MCYTYAHLYGLQIVCLRFFTVYGPRQRPNLAIHKFLALLEAAKPIPFFGNGSSGRDYTYVDDIVAGVIAALEYRHPSTGDVLFEIFNLGNPHTGKLSELVCKLEQFTGRQAVLRKQPNQPGDVPLTWADIGKAGCLLGYRPAMPLDEGLKKFIAWYRRADAIRRA
jgi:UDP-glucuronate 4-epimerase